MKRMTWIFALAACAAGYWGPGALAAEYRHPATGLVFPETLAGMGRISVHDYEPDSPGMGVSVGYKGPGMTATIYLYAAGMDAIPDGIDSPEVKEHFRQVVEEIVAYGRSNKQEDMRKTAEGEASFGTPGAERRALSADFRFSLDGASRRSKVDLLGWQNHFLKVRYTYETDVKDTAERTHGELMDLLADRMKPASAVPAEVPAGGGE